MRRYSLSILKKLLCSLTYFQFLKVCVMCNIILQSPTLTSWGEWGAFEKCPNGSFVSGVQLKVEGRQAAVHDDTALNGIRFFCTDLNGEGPVKATLESTVGPWGEWRSVFNCNGVVTGFQLRSESPQGKHDDTGANNLRVFCSDKSTIEGEGLKWGEWTPEQRCRPRQAVCGLQTQVEMPQGYGTLGGDDTALNNLKVECCDISNPSADCVPTDSWELVAECDNTNAFTPTTCSYERKIGLGYSTSHSGPSSNEYSSSHKKTILENLGFSLGIEAEILSQKFQVETGASGKTGYNWESARTDTWNHETSTRVTFDVPPGVKTSMVQVVGSCGQYLVRTSKFQRLDTVGTSNMNNNNNNNINNNNDLNNNNSNNNEMNENSLERTEPSSSSVLMRTRNGGRNQNSIFN